MINPSASSLRIPWVGQAISSDGQGGDLLSRFNGVYLQDGTKIGLPAALNEQWPSNKGSGMHVQACIEYATGQWHGLWVEAGTQRENTGPAVETPLPQGSLRLTDSGYLNLSRLRHWDREGRLWIIPLTSNLVFLDERGVRCSLLDLLQRHPEAWVNVQMRLVAQRLPQGERGAAGIRSALQPRERSLPIGRKPQHAPSWERVTSGVIATCVSAWSVRNAKHCWAGAF